MTILSFFLLLLWCGVNCRAVTKRRWQEKAKIKKISFFSLLVILFLRQSLLFSKAKPNSVRGGFGNLSNTWETYVNILSSDRELALNIFFKMILCLPWSTTLLKSMVVPWIVLFYIVMEQYKNIQVLSEIGARGIVSL